MAVAAGENRAGPTSIGDLQGHTFAGGEHSQSVFASLLGVKSPDEAEPGELRLTTVAWVRERVELTIDVASADGDVAHPQAAPGAPGLETPPAAEGETAPDGPTVVVIERFHTGRSGLAHSRSLNLWARNKGIPRELVARLDICLRGPLGRLTMEHLAQILVSDPELGASRYEAPPLVAAARERDFDRQAFLFNWGGEDIWYQFFATAELSRHRLESLDLLNHATSVNHCDRECLANEPHIPLRVPLNNFPWDERIRRTAGGKRGLAPPEREAQPEIEQALPEDLRSPSPPRPPKGQGRGGEGDTLPEQAHYTDMTDYDVIMGGTQKFLKVLNHAIDHVHGDMIFAHITCIPAVTGEDVESVIAQAQERSPVPILTLTMTPDAKDVIFEPILLEKRQEAEAAVHVTVPNAVNLIGFPEDNATGELTALLGELGVVVNVVLLPVVQLERVKRLPLAPLHVIHPNEFWQNLYNKLLFDTRIRAINPEAPFGFERTARWLEAVVREVGTNTEGVAAVVEKAWAPHAGRWTQLKEEAARQRLGFVMGAHQVRQVAESGTTWGVALLGVLEEMGFSLDFILHTPDQKTGREAAKELQKALAEPRRHRVRFFQTPSQLGMLLRSGPFSAVYSEHFFDFRLTRSGKAQFSLNVFERGFAGAVRTLERLLEICRFPLYRRYGKYMGEPFPWASDEEALASLAPADDKRDDTGGDMNGGERNGEDRP